MTSGKSILIALAGMGALFLPQPLNAEAAHQGLQPRGFEKIQLAQRPGPRRPNDGQPDQQRKGPTGDGTIKITLLGTGGGPGGGGPNLITKKMNASTLIEAGGRQFLFDAGRGAMLRLAALGPRYVRRTNMVFLTHLHSDHIVDLSDLFLNGGRRGARPILTIRGPKGTAKMIGYLVKAYAWDLAYRVNPRNSKPKKMIGHDITQGVVYDQDRVKITAFDVDHWPPRKSARARDEFPALGFRLDYNGHSVLISGDTRFSENTIKFGKGVDVLIHEVHAGLDQSAKRQGGRPQRGSHHTGPREAGEIFNRVKPKLAVYTHIVWARKSKQDLIELTREKYAGPLVVGEEMMQILIGDRVEVLRR